MEKYGQVRVVRWELYYDTLSSSGGSGTKMPPNAVFVQNVMGKCIMVKRFDGGTVLDSAGGSELSGIAKQQEWCLEDGEPTFTLKGYKGSSKLLPCTYTWAQKCYVNNPGEWNIYRRNDDKRKGFDPITGEEIKS